MVPKVLVCDNEEVVRSLIRASLSDSACELLEAHDADEAVALARRELPDLILLDLTMPGRSGLDVLAELRAEPRLAHTRIVMLTASTQAADREAAARAGAVGFLTKPFSPLELAVFVAEILDDR